MRATTKKTRQIRSANVIIFTIGHSTRSIEEFIAMLREHRIGLLADVRSVPGSRVNPQFNREDLSKSLKSAGIAYLHLKELGGWRKPRPDSPNTGLTSRGFRGYADYMLTGAFRTALDRLIELARESPTAILCAEALPWRCHRWLISDALVARGVSVEHLLGGGKTGVHALSSLARVHDGMITYPESECPTAGKGRS